MDSSSPARLDCYSGYVVTSLYPSFDAQRGRLCPLCGSSSSLNKEHVLPDWYLKLRGNVSLGYSQPHNVNRLIGSKYTIPICSRCNSRAGKVLEEPVSAHFRLGTPVAEETLSLWCIWVIAKMRHQDYIYRLRDAETHSKHALPLLRAVDLYLNHGYRFDSSTITMAEFSSAEEGTVEEYGEFHGLLIGANGRTVLFAAGGFARRAASAIEEMLAGVGLADTQLSDVAASIGAYSTGWGVGTYVSEDGVIRCVGHPRIPWQKSGILDRSAVYLHALSSRALKAHRPVLSSVLDGSGKLLLCENPASDSAFTTLGFSAQDIAYKGQPCTGSMLLAVDARAAISTARMLWRNSALSRRIAPDTKDAELARYVLQGQYVKAALFEAEPLKPAHIFQYGFRSVRNTSEGWVSSFLW